MRRSVLVLAAAVPLFTATTGCEDGPNQPYSPAPAGAATIWNGSPGTGGIPEGGTYTNPGTEQYDAGFGGTNANILCTADQAKTIWTKYFQEPILPPGLAGGLDIAGGANADGLSGWAPGMPFTYDPSKESWKGATVEQAEKLLCNATSDTIFGTSANPTLGWGNGCPICELSAMYIPSSRIITDLLFQYGYAAPIPATSTDGKSTYAIALNNTPMTKTTSAGTTQIIIDWAAGQGANSGLINEIFDALRNTYNPQFPPEADCLASGHCVFGNNYTQGGYFWYPPLGLAIFVNNTTAPQPAASTPGLIDLTVLKLMPWSLGQVHMKLDNAGVGPTITVPNVVNTGTTCTYQLGMTWGTFDSTCLEPSKAMPSVNAADRAKMFGAMTHTDEAYEFNIVGIDPQFTATLGPTAVISDTQRPTAADVAYELTVDQQAFGPLVNDYINNNGDPPTCVGGTPGDMTMTGTCQLDGAPLAGQTCNAATDCSTKDLHGIGMLTLEWANIVQQYMVAHAGVTSKLGDPDCLAPNGPTAGLPAGAGGPANGKVCSGIEGIVTTAPPALAPASMAVNALGLNALNIEPSYAVGLKPSTWVVDFCTTPGDPTMGTGYSNCEGGSYGGPLGGAYFNSMQYAVSTSFGSNPIPTLLASRRFFFQQFILAAIKYLQTADNPSATLAQIDANPIDNDQLFFDSAGGGFENGNYVFRNSVNSAMQAPTLLNISTNLTTSVMNNWTFARYNFRGDKALYTALTTNPSDQPGAEPNYLSNLAGSAVLQSVYGAGSAPCPAGTTKCTGYQCAIDTTGTTPGCSGAMAPVDPLTGKALYAPYQGAFGATIFNIAHNGATPQASPMTVATSTDLELIQSANVTLPIWSNPYDPTSATPQDKTISVLLPYIPKGANVGFPVTIDGSRDKFYNTAQVQFTGVENLPGSSLDTVVDFEYVPLAGADGGVTNSLVVRALETTSYLGLIFACAQPSISQPGAQDILAIRMYDNVNTVLSWIAAHPGSVAACGVQIKYSIYGNYADYISFLSNGVRIGFNPGFGGSVASDGTIFDPNVVASLGQ